LEEGYARVLSDILSGTVINQMSMSYGLGETYPTVFYTTSQFTTDNNYFSEISSAGTGVNQGVSIFASSGDGGSTPGLKTAGDESDPTVQVEFPASSSYVTGVGGTAPTLDSSGNESAEIVWNDSDGASGGGTSVAVSRPGWQTFPVPPPRIPEATWCSRASCTALAVQAGPAPQSRDFALC
jgi:subtilase family serine protease